MSDYFRRFWIPLCSPKKCPSRTLRPCASRARAPLKQGRAIDRVRADR
jgi:hypothetical protein